VSYEKQELLTLRLSSPPGFWCDLFSLLCCPIIYLYRLNSMLWCPLRFPRKNDVRPHPQLLVGGLMPYLRYLCLLEYIGVKHILCWVFWGFFRLVYTMLSVSEDCPFLIVPSVFSNVYLSNEFMLIPFGIFNISLSMVLLLSLGRYLC
jgi:hypothetical protein